MTRALCRGMEVSLTSEVGAEQGLSAAAQRNAIYDPTQMQGATEHLRRQARRIVEAALERVPLKAAMLVGSAGRGDADFYSDLDLLLYVDELPPDGTLTPDPNGGGWYGPDQEG